MKIGRKNCWLFFAGIIHFASLPMANAIEVTATQISPTESILTAENQTYGTKSAVVTVLGRNIASTTKFPIKISLPPGQSVQIGKVINNEPESENKFRIHVESLYGKLNAETDSKIYYRLPFQNGLTFRISQAFGSKGGTHYSVESLHAVDFDMPVGTQVVAARAGVVVDSKYDSDLGGPHESYIGKVNYVTIEHDDGTLGNYAHLAKSEPFVQVGQRISMGQIIGLSGNTGYSTGPHLHFAVTRPAIINGKMVQESIPITFFAYKPAVSFKPRPMIIVTADYTSEFKGKVISLDNQGR